MTCAQRRAPLRVARLTAAFLLGLTLVIFPGGPAGGAGDRAALPASPAKAPLTVVSLTFDGAFASQEPAAELLASRSLPATFYVNSGLLGARPYATGSWVRKILAQGHEVGGHTRGHVDLVDLPAAAREPAVCGDRRMLAGLGVQATSFAYPYGSYDDDVVALVQRCGYTSARTTSGLNVGDGTCGDCPETESLEPIDHRYNVRTPGVVTSVDDWRDLARLVRRGERQGGWLPLVFHRICEDCAPESTSLETLDAFTAWLSDRPSSTVVLTAGEVASGIRQPDPNRSFGTPPTRTVVDSSRGGEPESGNVIWILGVPVDQLFLLGGGLALTTLLIAGHRLATRSRRHR